MGTVITLDYSDMENSFKKADKASKECDSYIDKIESKITKKIDGLKGGGNGNTSSANYFANEKKRKLREKSKKYSTYAQNMKAAKKYAADTDKRVSELIKAESKDFRKVHNMETNVITDFFTWASTTLLNSTAFGRWLSEVGRDIGRWIDAAGRKFKEWYRLDGGKYVIKTVLAVVGTVIAVVFLVAVAWPALLAAIGAFGSVIAGTAVLTGGMIWTAITAAAGFATAVIAVTDGLTKVFSNGAAALTLSDDPGWAARYGGFSSLSDWARSTNFKNSIMNKISYSFSDIYDGVDIACSIINVIDLTRHGIRVLSDLKAKRYELPLRKLGFKGADGKMHISFSTIKYNCKKGLQNLKTIKDVFTNTGWNQLTSHYEKALKYYGAYKKTKSAQKFFDKVVKDGFGRATGNTFADNYSTTHNIGKEYYSTGKSIYDFHTVKASGYY